MSGDGAATQHVRVGNVNVAYRAWGQGEPLLLITGFAATMDVWDPTFLAELATDHRVILFDNRGVGGTTAPPGDFSIGQLAADALGLLRGLGVERARVVGYSMGGYVAQELALQAPDRVTHLVLMGTGCGAVGIPPRPEVLRALSDMSGSVEEILRRVIAVLVPDEWSRRHGADLRSILLRPPAPPTAKALAAQRLALDTWPGTAGRLSQLGVPTLVLTGTADEVVPPRNALLLAQGIPGAWLAQLAGGGHGMQYQYPRQFAAIMRAFFAAPWGSGP
jgi:pimeloyl-ACP methyl ester carboxylesterase